MYLVPAATAGKSLLVLWARKIYRGCALDTRHGLRVVQQHRLLQASSGGLWVFR